MWPRGVRAAAPWFRRQGENRATALKIEAVLTVLYAAVLAALIWLGNRYWPNVLTGTFFAGLGAWKLRRHHRGREPHRTPWLDWLMLASALVLLAATVPQRP